jgi:hypothetical protein
MPAVHYLRNSLYRRTMDTILEGKTFQLSLVDSLPECDRLLGCTSCSLVGLDRRFGCAYSLCHQGDDGASTHL